MNMQFVSKTSNNNYFYYINQNEKLNPQGAYVMPIMRPAISKRSVPQVEQQPDNTPPVKKMRWGEPTWFLFHTLAHKIKDEFFHEKKMEILNTISLICANLPCPNCANHATEYMKNINFYAIQTKQDLKNMLFQFHNVVNQRKGVPVFRLMI